MDKFHKFASKIMTIGAPITNIFGGGIPGNIGSSTQGSTTSGNDVINQLKMDTGSYADELRKPKPDNDSLSEMSNKIEGSILALGSMSILSQKEVDALVDELHDL